MTSQNIWPFIVQWEEMHVMGIGTKNQVSQIGTGIQRSGPGFSDSSVYPAENGWLASE